MKIDQQTRTGRSRLSRGRPKLSAQLAQRAIPRSSFGRYGPCVCHQQCIFSYACKHQPQKIMFSFCLFSSGSSILFRGGAAKKSRCLQAASEYAGFRVSFFEASMVGYVAAGILQLRGSLLLLAPPFVFLIKDTHLDQFVDYIAVQSARTQFQSEELLMTSYSNLIVESTVCL
jgi:hypothetical protein